MLQMISASGDFLPSEDSWRLLRSQNSQPGSRSSNGAAGGPPPPSESVARVVDARDGTGGVVSQAVPAAAAAADQQGLVSWTPKREGQGSWDKNKAASAAAATASSAGLEAPVWRVDLVRGVYTGVIKIKQVLFCFAFVLLLLWFCFGLLWLRACFALAVVAIDEE